MRVEEFMPGIGAETSSIDGAQIGSHQGIAGSDRNIIPTPNVTTSSRGLPPEASSRSTQPRTDHSPSSGERNGWFGWNPPKTKRGRKRSDSIVSAKEPNRASRASIVRGPSSRPGTPWWRGNEKPPPPARPSRRRPRGDRGRTPSPWCPKGRPRANGAATQIDTEPRTASDGRGDRLTGGHGARRDESTPREG